jgi:hypothetical protein
MYVCTYCTVLLPVCRVLPVVKSGPSVMVVPHQGVVMHCQLGCIIS